MATPELPSPDVLRKLLRYEPDTGKLFWRKRTPDMFNHSATLSESECRRWNSRYANSQAFTALNNDGYMVGRIFSKPYRAHRVIWAMETGAWPQGGLDHINGNPADNRLQNLRQCTQAQNSRNRRAHRNSISGYKGVAWNRRYENWYAHITVNGKRIHLGCFSDPQEAARAYDNAATHHHQEFVKLNFQTRSL